MGEPKPQAATILKHITTLFALSDHYILNREWRVIVYQVLSSLSVHEVLALARSLNNNTSGSASPLVLARHQIPQQISSEPDNSDYLLTLSERGTVFIRQNLTSVDVRF